MKVVSQASIAYAYSVGNLKINSITNSNVVETEIRNVELLAKKTASQESFKPNDIITYTLVIQNPGNTKVTDIVINDDLYHQQYIENSFKYTYLDNSNETIKLTSNENNLIFEIKELNPNSVIIMNYQVKLDSLEDISIDIRNYANIESKEIAPFKTNNIDLKQKYAKVECTKKCVDHTFYNTDISYIIILHNAGNVDAIDLEVVDQLPKTFELDKNNPIKCKDKVIDIYSFDNDTHILKFLIDNLSPNEKIEVIIKGRIIK